jgi:hypothetical protein
MAWTGAVCALSVWSTAPASGSYTLPSKMRTVVSQPPAPSGSTEGQADGHNVHAAYVWLRSMYGGACKLCVVAEITRP